MCEKYSENRENIYISLRQQVNKRRHYKLTAWLRANKEPFLEQGMTLKSLHRNSSYKRKFFSDTVKLNMYSIS